MKESEYIVATDLQRIRDAIKIVGDIYSLTPQRRKIQRELHIMNDTLRNKLGELE